MEWFLAQPLAKWEPRFGAAIAMVNELLVVAGGQDVGPPQLVYNDVIQGNTLCEFSPPFNFIYVETLFFSCIHCTSFSWLVLPSPPMSRLVECYLDELPCSGVGQCYSGVSSEGRKLTFVYFGCCNCSA